MDQTDKTLPTRGPTLLVRVDGQTGVKRFAKTFGIGRAADNDLVILDRSVSQHHAEVVFEGGGWRIRDLESTNGTVVGGERIDEAEIESTLRVRLGHQGPGLRLELESRASESQLKTAVPTDSTIRKRYLAPRDPEHFGHHTAAVRRVFARVQRRRAKRYIIALAVVSLVGGGAVAYSVHLQREIERQKAAAEELFYTAKALELEIGELELSAEERQSLRARRDELDQQYRDFIEELGIYSDQTPEEVRLIYRVAHRFGESEVNIPQAFVDEVTRYIERWKSTTRLDAAIARAESNGYSQRIADIMLEHDLPPEFFFLALQESDFKLEAVGPETRFGIAKGMWQFMPGTARDYGLRTGPLVGVGRPDPLDDRHDFEKATRAAASYLRRLYNTDAQASGLLVAASYNWGQTRVLRLIRTMPENPRERNFWQLLTLYRDRVPNETYDYVFSIVSAAVIGENPELFGFEFEVPFKRPEPITDEVAGVAVDALVDAP
jgi:pSer/pThr/pTyr-binding forkhead associated (FHA) protein